ncbi:MAG: hypothetical protein RL071_274, partial [Pseudomonadota bacterium]
PLALGVWGRGPPPASTPKPSVDRATGLIAAVSPSADTASLIKKSRIRRGGASPPQRPPAGRPRRARPAQAAFQKQRRRRGLNPGGARSDPRSGAEGLRWGEPNGGGAEAAGLDLGLGLHGVSARWVAAVGLTARAVACPAQAPGSSAPPALAAMGFCVRGAACCESALLAVVPEHFCTLQPARSRAPAARRAARAPAGPKNGGAAAPRGRRGPRSGGATVAPSA